MSTFTAFGNLVDRVTTLEDNPSSAAASQTLRRYVSSSAFLAGVQLYSRESSNSDIFRYDAGAVVASPAITLDFTGDAASLITVSGLNSSTGTFTHTTQLISKNQVITVSGTLPGGTTITGYTDPTTFYAIPLSLTTFKLSLTVDGAAVTTTGTSTSGLTFTLDPSEWIEQNGVRIIYSHTGSSAFPFLVTVNTDSATKVFSLANGESVTLAGPPDNRSMFMGILPTYVI